MIIIHLRRQKKAARKIVAEETIGDGKPELDGRDTAAIGRGVLHPLVNAPGLMEVDDGTPRVELWGNSRAELDGRSRIY